MNKIIERNACNAMVDQKLRTGQKLGIPTKYTNPFHAFNSLVDENVIPSPCLNIIIRKDETKRDFTRFPHGICCWPVRDTFIKAIKRLILQHGPV